MRESSGPGQAEGLVGVKLLMSGLGFKTHLPNSIVCSLLNSNVKTFNIYSVFVSKVCVYSLDSWSMSGLRIDVRCERVNGTLHPLGTSVYWRDESND